MALSDATDDLELLLRRIVREEAGVTPVVPADKWRGGTLVLRPGTAGLQEKVIPIDALFHKIVMIRNQLRTLEQQVYAPDLPDDSKLMTEEPFGPIAPIVWFKTFDEVVERANSLPFGLAAYAFTTSAQTATMIGDAIQSGMVGGNSIAISTP